MRDRALAVAAWVDGAVLVTSGVALLFLYRPSPAAGNPLADGATLSDWLRVVHRTSAGVLAVVVLVWLVTSLVRRRAAVAALAAAAALLVGAGWLSGWWLPWDQLALWSVTVGERLTGHLLLWDDRVRFVVVGGEEVSVEWLRAATLVHAAVIPLLLVVAAALGRRHDRRAGRAIGPRSEVDVTDEPSAPS